MAPKKKPKITSNDFAALEAIITRAALGARLGQSYAGERDVYTALGYSKILRFDDYMGKYKRQDIAKAVINAPVSYSWLKPPILTDSEKDDTDFEKAWIALVKDRRIYHYMARADRLAGVGKYSIMILGTDDKAEFDQPLEKASELLYLTPVSEKNATIKTCVTETKDPRFGLPETYQVTFSQGGSTSLSKQVHHSRVIHIAEEQLEGDTEGTPKLEAVYNRLENLELIVGGGAEMFWRGALPGMGFKIDPGFDISDQDKDALKVQIEEYIHGLSRTLRLKGVSIEEIKQQIADPTGNAAIVIDLIACATRIPKRILMGSERGELASSMDEQSWLMTIESRRLQHCEPTIIRPFVDRLITTGILPAPMDGYTVEWPDLMNANDKDVAEVAVKVADAMKKYMESGANEIMPIEVFFEEVLGLSKEKIAKILEILGEVDKLVAPEPEEEE